MSGFIGCCLPPLGNLFIAEKIGADGIEKYIGLCDFLGGGGLCSALGQIILRGKIRAKDDIDGGSIGDVFAACCCLPCSICQQSNHVEVWIIPITLQEPFIFI